MWQPDTAQIIQTFRDIFPQLAEFHYPIRDNEANNEVNREANSEVLRFRSFLAESNAFLQLREQEELRQSQLGIQIPAFLNFNADVDGDEPNMYDDNADFDDDILNMYDDLRMFEVDETVEVVPETFPLEIEAEPECPVCQEGSNLLILGCRHTICDPCIRKLSKKTCPNCREPITMNLVRKHK
jgi:hypothetical protein